MHYYLLSYLDVWSDSISSIYSFIDQKGLLLYVAIYFHSSTLRAYQLFQKNYSKSKLGIIMSCMLIYDEYPRITKTLLFKSAKFLVMQ